ncbi:6-phosphogluconolactonase [Streptomyces tubercidicus]
MHHELQVVADPDAVAGTAAAFVARLARACVQAHGRFTFAVSGGHTPWAMFARLVHEHVPWKHVAVFQVDERVGRPYMGHQRMTLTYPALARAQQVLWLITGADKRQPLSA